ncbi:MAG: hypothetical protein AAGF11_49490 [Myxococcota bacterium]
MGVHLGRVPRLPARESSDVHPGQARVFLPGDVHDTDCVSDRVVVLRLTSCDFGEELRSGRMTRYVERAGVWTAPTAHR